MATHRLRFWSEAMHGWWGWVNIAVDVTGIIAIVAGESNIGLPKTGLPWYVWVIIILVTLIVSVLETAYRLVRRDSESNWVKAYEFHNHKLPPLPDRLFDLVHNYERGQPISKNIEFIPLSGQGWAGLKPSEQKKYIQLVEWRGEDPDDYIPKIPAAITTIHVKNQPRRFRL